MFDARKAILQEMFKVQNTILSEDIATAKFACDLPKCKGACCVVGDAGAPVSEEEIPKLEKIFTMLKDELHPQAREEVSRKGIVQMESHGEYRLSCRNNKECIFVSYSSDGVAYCAIQKAFLKGRIDWEKPLSCHLFPLRLRRIADFEYANFEYVNRLCSTACIKGEKEEIYLSDFLEKPLIRRYGKEWYNEFVEACKEIRTENSEAV
jgi:hypothetical protein